MGRVPRFVQLFILASLILLVPSLLYLSHDPVPTLVDPKTGLAYTADSLPVGANADANPLAQVSQGDGVDLSHDPNHRWGIPWPALHKPVHKVESAFNKFVDALKGTKQNGSHGLEPIDKQPAPAPASPGAQKQLTNLQKEEKIDGVIMPKMGNETAKAALGRSTWHFLHTMTLRFPDKPSPEESATLKSFFETFALLYPCGDCARHFQGLIKEQPPQTASRMNAALWLCSIHNEVNKRLKKPEFPCDKLDETYDCGCGPDDKDKDKGKKGEAKPNPDPAPAPAAAGGPAKDGGVGLTPFARRSSSAKLEEGVRSLGRRALELATAPGLLSKRSLLGLTDECLCRVR